MQQYVESIKLLQRKFYQYSGNFNNFDKIDRKKEEELKRIFSYTSRAIITPGIDCYVYYLNLLVNSTSAHFITFDERLYLLISFIDSELITFKEYLTANIMPSKEFEDLNEQKKYNEERKKQISVFQSCVRNKLGFYDENLIEYEAKYLGKFYSSKLFENVNKDYSALFLKYAQFISSFSSISKERLTEIEIMADDWLKIQQNSNHFTTAAFNIFFQNNILKLNNIKEQFVFFILVNDRNLKALGIHEEESKVDKEKARCLEELGFYNPNFIKIEQIYHDTFYPDLKVSPFTIIKKDKH